MRRTVAAVVVALSTALAISTRRCSDAGAGRPSDDPTSARAVAVRALHTATRVLAGRGDPHRRTVALLRLRLTMNALRTCRPPPAPPRSWPGRPTAPTDLDAADLPGPGQEEVRRPHLHPLGADDRDAPPSKRWVDKSSRCMNNVWTFEVESSATAARSPTAPRRRRLGEVRRLPQGAVPRACTALTVAEQRTSSNKRLYSSLPAARQRLQAAPSSTPTRCRPRGSPRPTSSSTPSSTATTAARTRG